MTGKRAPATFRQRDVVRAVKAVAAAGVDIGRIEIDRAGTIRIVPAGPSRHDNNPLDLELQEWEARRGQS
jgi:hypothetical protein